MYSVLGYISVFLLLLLLLPMPLRLLNKKYFKSNKRIAWAIRLLKKNHRIIGILLLVVSLAHGYLAMGGFRLHTGSILYLGILLVSLSGMYFIIKKKKSALKIHRFLSFAVIRVIGGALFLSRHIVLSSQSLRIAV